MMLCITLITYYVSVIQRCTGFFTLAQIKIGFKCWGWRRIAACIVSKPMKQGTLLSENNQQSGATKCNVKRHYSYHHEVYFLITSYPEVRRC